MVAYSAVLASNAQISTHMKKPFVALFAGATSGIGEVTLTTLLKYVPQPRIYLFARNETSAERVIAKCQQINPQGQYTFVKADLSSIKETDHACDFVKSTEVSVNLVVVSAGEIKLGSRKLRSADVEVISGLSSLRFESLPPQLPPKA